MYILSIRCPRLVFQGYITGWYISYLCDRVHNLKIYSYINAVIIHPPSYGGPHHATATRSGPLDILGRPPGGSGGPSTATDADAISLQLPYSVKISTLYFPLWSAVIEFISRVVFPLPV